MRNLEDIKLGHRVMLTVAIVIILIIILGFTGWLTGGWDAAGKEDMPDVYQGIPLDEHLLRLDKTALEQAYTTQLGKLFNIWLTDGAKEASRISTGLHNARRAYGQAAAQITKRENELQKSK